ncbi:MAG TPA: glycosyltransferase, partial [Lacipirellulaceae bacterium]|nr:glycosyltransferase [Lacipirellulaceae bacterium]
MSRRVLFVAAEFPPCNLTAGHRTRLFVRNLPEFGYAPIVLTVQASAYETRLEEELASLVAPDVEIIRTRALPTRPVRLVGDLGVRSFPYFASAMRRLIRERNVDLVYLPIPPNYSSLLGPIARYLWRTPFVIDYIDPWVRPATEQDRQSWKGRASCALARMLEPIALCGVGGITGVAESYFADVRARHPRLIDRPSAGIPYGGEPLDHAIAMRDGRPSAILQDTGLDDRLVLAYCGAMLPRAYGTLRTLLTACRQWVESGDPLAAKLTLLFVGTGMRPNDPRSGTVAPVARECGAQDFVVEVAHRQPYLEILRLLHQAHGVMILGSSERHYTASKTFQSLMSGRPILAMLHAESSAAEVLAKQSGVELVTFNDDQPVETCQEQIL